MTQEKNPSAAPSLGLLARLPWWVGVLLAAAAFLSLHQAAGVGQVLVPLLCLVLAAGSAWQRRLAARELTLSRNPEADGLDTVDAADPLHAPVQPDFEDTVPPCPLCHGAMVRRAARGGPDAGRVYWGCMNAPACGGRLDVE
ncbi:hypothetical protein [Azohydromonas aeria]|uniref:hypothetical protein n=1 Tax=Azohydromonas aeria TaxID=2590212 RepID=UPI0012F7E1CC|nr:hypothetical protein [Azohydromonas aeria]